MASYTLKQLLERARRRYSVARGVLASRRKRAREGGNGRTPGVVTKAEAAWIKDAAREVDEALEHLEKRKRQFRRKPMRELALEHALRDLKVRETQGNNWGGKVTTMIREIGWEFPVAWCGVAVAYWYRQAGSTMAGKPWSYVPTLEQLLTRIQRRANVKPGHVVIYNWNGGVPDHTGLFLRWVDRKAGVFEAVEGNTRPGTQTSDAGGGEGVHIRRRTLAEVSSFRRVLR